MKYLRQKDILEQSPEGVAGSTRCGCDEGRCDMRSLWRGRARQSEGTGSPGDASSSSGSTRVSCPSKSEREDEKAVFKG